MLPRKETRFIVITSTMTDERLTVQEVDWRGRKYGYLDAGCHYVIADGEASPVRPLHLMGVGVVPHNDVSVIITLAGNDPYSWQQLADLANIVDYVLAHYPDAQVVGHSDLPGARTEAPGFDVAAWWVGRQAQKAIGG